MVETNFSSFLNGVSIDDTVINNAGGAVANTNAALQGAAALSGFLTANPATSLVAVLANSVALGSASTNLEDDVVAGNQQNAIGDGISVIGDAIGLVGGIVGALGAEKAALPVSI